MNESLGKLIKDYAEPDCPGSRRTLLRAIKDHDLELAQEIIPISMGAFEEIVEDYEEELRSK